MQQLDVSPDLAAMVTREVLAKRSAYIINLSAIKAHSGVLWDKLSKGIHLRLEKIMARMLTPVDSFVVVDEIRHAVIMPSLDSTDAAIVAVRIASELAFDIHGVCDVEQIRIESIVSLDKSKLSVSLLTHQEIARLVERADVANIGGISGRRKAAEEPDPSATVAQKERSGIGISHRFEPVWDPRREAITTYFCVPYQIRSLDDGNAVPHQNLSARERTEADLSCIAAGIGYLSEWVELGDRFVLGLSIAFETLCSPVGRMEFVRMCRGLPATYRPYLLFMLSDVPLGVTQSRLSDLAALVRPFGRAAAEVAGGCRNFNAYQGHGFCALTMNYGDPLHRTAGATADIVHLAAAAANSRMSSIAFGLTDKALINQACAADMQLLHGSAVAEPCNRPKRMTRLLRSEVLGTPSEEMEEWF